MKCMETSRPMRTEVTPGIWVDSRRALFIAPQRLLVVADIHWGFAQSHRAIGNLLPLWGDDEIAQILNSLVEDYEPIEMIWLGDSLHTLDGRFAAELFLRNRESLGTKTTVLSGNHDRRWTLPQAKALHRENYYFHHGDDLSATIPHGATEVIGHFHPAVGLYDGAGLRLRVPALVASDRRFILPAFSPWAAGVTWNDRVQIDEKLWAVAPSRVFAVRGPQAHARLSPP